MDLGIGGVTINSLLDLGLVMQNEYFQALLIMVFSFLLGYVVYKFMRTSARDIQRKGVDANNSFPNMISLPVYWIIVVGGVYLALKSIASIAQYHSALNNIFFVLIVVLAAISLSRVVSTFFANWLRTQKGVQKTPKLITKIINGIIYLIGLLMILDFFNVAITPLLATLGLGALAIGLALQPTLSNLFAGLRLLSDKMINVGDYIELDAKTSGYVEDIGWNSTKIRTLPNNMVIVPNSKLADSVIINNSLPKKEMAVFVNGGVAYASDLKKAEKVIIDTAKKIQGSVPGAVKGFQPFMRFTSFGDVNINFWVMLMVESYVDQHLVIHEFIKALKDAFRKEKIEMSGPMVQKREL